MANRTSTYGLYATSWTCPSISGPSPSHLPSPSSVSPVSSQTPHRQYQAGLARSSVVFAGWPLPPRPPPPSLSSSPSPSSEGSECNESLQAFRFEQVQMPGGARHQEDLPFIYSFSTIALYFFPLFSFPVLHSVESHPIECRVCDLSLFLA